MKTWHIHIKGKVQGVGFRPFIFQKAIADGLKGWVSNTVDGVHLEFNATASTARIFLDKIIRQAPVLAEIIEYEIYAVDNKHFSDFQIIHQPPGHVPTNLLITPDAAICEDCRSELCEKGNHRHHYAFITCTNCGPRYSIIHTLPYDRPGTTMDAFTMCPGCQREYTDPNDRRYYSQTNSCPDCAVQLSLYSVEQQEIKGLSQEEIINYIPELWQDGKIIAIKGVGGYLLTCDANNPASIRTLRLRKHRPSKPFALMFPDLTTLNQLVELREVEAKAMQFPVAPIVLLALKDTNVNDVQTSTIAPGLNHIGCMLPYTPLYELLLKKYGHPIIATSGNVSQSPILYRDEQALDELNGIADFILSNNRRICVPQDDSVVKFTPVSKTKIIVRRSRGYAPTLINPDFNWPLQSVFATGAMLKSTFALLHLGNTYLSQYLGDLDHFNVQQNFHHTFQHLSSLIGAQPEVILSDLHPEYPSSLYAEELSTSLDLPVIKVQHHIAHFCAVLGEHNLIHSKEPILGVIWDGTGLGNDGQIWGGEFFNYENHKFHRCLHFDYFDLILGNKMPKEPRVSALASCWGIPGLEDVIGDKFTPTEWQVYSKLLSKQNHLQTSSVGRIFDAVASLLDLMDKQTYEGEAAMRLEGLAWQYFKKNGLECSESYFEGQETDARSPTKSLMTGIIQDIKAGREKNLIAAKFHYSLVKMIKAVAYDLKITRIAFSGGVFQNSVLVDLLHYHLGDEFILYFHRQLSPNDENISWGQLVYYTIQTHRRKRTPTASEEMDVPKLYRQV